VICTLEDFWRGQRPPLSLRKFRHCMGTQTVWCTSCCHGIFPWKWKYQGWPNQWGRVIRLHVSSGLQIALGVQWKLLLDKINDFSKGIPIFASPSSTDYKDYMCLLEGHLKWVSVVPITLVSSSRRYVYLSIGFGYVALIKSELRVLFEDPKFRLKTF
jgi:hypothetical protein